MKRLLMAVALLAATAAFAADPADVLKDADRKFAADSLKNGSAAWERWFATYATKPGPNNTWIVGNKAIGEQMSKPLGDPNFTLEWEPVTAQLSKGGNLGYTWGRWTRKRKQADGSVKTTTGDYMTVWEKQKDGSWKVVFDTGDAD